MFSALSEKDQISVIDICLVRLLRLAKAKYKFGIQISGISLEILEKNRPELLVELKKFIENGQIDFIGNGYSQIIQPIFPEWLGQKNQEIGKKTYNKILSYKPRLGTINEMALSNGSISSFIDNGYKTLLMEFDNLSVLNQFDQQIHFSPVTFQTNDNSIDLLWCDTLAFQKFQRYVHGEISLKSYLNWLNLYTGKNKGVLCLYCSDAEVFNFRPKRYNTEIDPVDDEWDRVEKLLRKLNTNTILPSEACKIDKVKVHSLTNFEYPIVVKKQEKYNINRWSVTGRHDQKLNTFCYRVAMGLQKSENITDKNIKDLLKLSSSDLRTHIEVGRWREIYRLKDNLREFSFHRKNEKLNGLGQSKHYENYVTLDPHRGNNIRAFPKDNPALVHCEIGTFRNYKYLADFYSGFMVIERPGERKISDLDFNTHSLGSNYFNEHEHLDNTKLSKKILRVDKNSFSIKYSVFCPKRQKQQIKIANFTISPRYFDINSLYYSCTLGGHRYEKFKIQSAFDQNENLNLATCGKNGFTPTTGKLFIGDNNRKILFDADPADCFYLVRLSVYIENQIPLIRLSYIVQDIDETFKERNDSEEFHLTLNFTVC